MTPEYLACPTTNSQVEHIRRRIEASLPTSNLVDIHDQDPASASNDEYVNRSLQTTNKAAGFNKFGRALYDKPTTSLENPLFSLTEAEYRTLRRFREERQAPPKRFANSARTPAQDNALYAPDAPPPANPTFQTSAQEYGKYPPNAHTLPHSYHGLSTGFTAKKTLQGNYRNHSMNL